jgi:hypothetical protein
VRRGEWASDETKPIAGDREKERRAEQSQFLTAATQLQNCIERYLDSRQNELGPKAATHTRLLLNRLKEYAHQHNKHFNP